MTAKPPKILVVDGDELQRRLTTTLLESAGFAVVAANDALVAIEATRLTKLAEQKRRTERHLSALLEGSHATFAVTTREGIVIEANVRWQTLLGIEPGVMMGQPIDEFVEQNDLRASGVVPLRHATSGKTVFVEFSITQLGEGELIVGHDVTARIEAERRTQMHSFNPLEDFEDTAVTRPFPRMR